MFYRGFFVAWMQIASSAFAAPHPPAAAKRFDIRMPKTMPRQNAEVKARARRRYSPPLWGRWPAGQKGSALPLPIRTTGRSRNDRIFGMPQGMRAANSSSAARRVLRSTPSGLPAISPTRGETTSSLTFTYPKRCHGRNAEVKARARRRYSPRLWGRWPAGQRGSALPLAHQDYRTQSYDRIFRMLQGILAANSISAACRVLRSTPSGLPAISPTRGETTSSLTFTYPKRCHGRNAGVNARAGRRYSPPLWGRWPAGQRGSALPLAHQDYRTQSYDRIFRMPQGILAAKLAGFSPWQRFQRSRMGAGTEPT